MTIYNPYTFKDVFLKKGYPQ